MAGKKQDTSKKREAILDGAVKAFCEEGYEASSMDRIAEFAVASKRTVYNHFPSKESLFQAVVDRFMEQASAIKNIPYDPSQSLEDQLGLFADAKMSMTKDVAMFGLMKATLGAFIHDPELGKITMERAQMGEDYLVKWLLAAKDDQKLQFNDAKLTAELFWSMISGAFIWPQLMQGAMSGDKIEKMKQELIQMFLSYYRV